MNIGIFGGSFDPVHMGHLLLAQQCLNNTDLDVIKFVPAAVSPHKQNQQPTEPAIRIEMLKLAIAGHEKFEVDTIEIDRGGVSYTVDTLISFREQLPDSNLFLLLGADSLTEFDTWKNPKLICEIATPIIVRRPPADKVDYDLLSPYVDETKLETIKQLSFRSLQIEISASEIRNSVANGKSIRFQTSRAVEELIRSKNLYRGS